jgi:hypothetical protein
MFVWYAVELAEFRCRTRPQSQGGWRTAPGVVGIPPAPFEWGPSPGSMSGSRRWSWLQAAAGRHENMGVPGSAESQVVDLCWPGWLMKIWHLTGDIPICDTLWKNSGRPLTSDFVEQPEAGNFLQFLFLIWASAHKRSWEPQPQTPLQALPVTATTLPMSPPNPEPSIVFLCSDCDVVFRNMPEFCWWWSITSWRRN